MSSTPCKGEINCLAIALLAGISVPESTSYQVIAPALVPDPMLRGTGLILASHGRDEKRGPLKTPAWEARPNYPSTNFFISMLRLVESVIIVIYFGLSKINTRSFSCLDLVQITKV